jgi:hypothetical protein
MVPVSAAAQTPSPTPQRIAQFCTPTPPPTATDFRFDAATGATQGPVRHRKSARPRLVIVNKNPFQYEYKVTVAETLVPEADLGAFLGLLGGPAVDLSPAPPAKETPKPKPEATVAAGPSGPCDSALEAIAQQQTAVAAARERAEAELAERKKAYDPLAKSVKGAEAVFKTNAVCEALYPLAARLAGDLANYDPKLDEFDEAIAAFSLAVRDQQARLDAFPATKCAQNITPQRTVNEGQQAAVVRLRAAHKQLTAEKARFDALLEKMQPILASPTAFTEVRQIGDYDLPTTVRITIERKERVDKAVFQSVLAQTLRFGGGARFAIAGGWVWSSLEQPQYSPVQGFPVDRDGKLLVPEVLGPTIGFVERSDSRQGPIAALHTRLWPEADKWNRLWLTFGVTAKNDNEGTTAEYMFGPSVSLAEDRAFITVGVYGGRLQELQGQLFTGGAVPADLADIPVEKNLHWRLGASLSWKIR